MDRHSHPEPRMPMIKQFSENGPVGVLKANCTTGADLTPVLTGARPIKLTSPRCPSAWQPNHGKRSTYSTRKNCTGPTSHSVPAVRQKFHLPSCADFRDQLSSRRPPVRGSTPSRGSFAKLAKRRLNRGVFRCVVDLQAAINRFVAEINHDPKPVTWTADPDKIIAAVRRGQLDSIH